jgi:hypothetical protein
MDEIAKLKAEIEKLKSLFCKEQDLIKLVERTQDDYEKCILEKEHFERRAKKVENTLQKIKKVAEVCSSEINCENCPFTDECNTEMEALGVCKIISNLITKAEEE